MGHSTYAFLLDGMGADLEPEELRDEALGCFESYAEHHCDENNYWMAQALVCRDGRVVPMVEPGDDREPLAASFLAMPVETRWNLAWQLACHGVLEEIGIELAELTPAALAEEVPKNLAAKLAVTFSAIAAGEKGREEWRRKLWSSAFELLSDAPTPPFAFPDSPYRYWPSTCGTRPTSRPARKPPCSSLTFTPSPTTT
jgi:hypothetical protein